MKITIEGTEKEIADFVLAVQNQQNSNIETSYKTDNLLVDILAANGKITSRYKRQLKSDKKQLEFYLKRILGINFNDIQLNENVDSGTHT